MGDAADGGPGDAPADLLVDQPPPPPVTLPVIGSQSGLRLDTCGLTPATFANVPAGTYTITLAASTLSKGSVSVTGAVSQDNYVIVGVPLPPGDPRQDHRFFMLNGIGANASVTLPATGTVEVMFIDADVQYNAGQATVTLEPGGYSAVVDATNNVVPWDGTCSSSPASLVVNPGLHRVTLTASTLSAGAGSEDSYVLLRIPSEKAMDDHRYVMLNGVGSSYDFTPFNADTLRAWFPSATAGATGQATITISDL